MSNRECLDKTDNVNSGIAFSSQMEGSGSKTWKNFDEIGQESNLMKNSISKMCKWNTSTHKVFAHLIFVEY